MSIKIPESERQIGKKIFLIGIVIMALSWVIWPFAGIVFLTGFVVTICGLFVWTTKEIDLSVGG